jgi:hypothetical protein
VPAQGAGALFHRGQSQATRAQRGVGGVEADAVVAHRQAQPPVLGLQPDVDVLGVGVAQCVLQRLLGDA